MGSLSQDSLWLSSLRRGKGAFRVLQQKDNEILGLPSLVECSTCCVLQ